VESAAACAYLGALGLGDSGEEGYEASVAEELGDEDGGLALHLGVVNPLQCGANLPGRGRMARAGASGACVARHAECFVCVDGSMRPDGNGASERPK
jgi:hypothetical protein